MLNELKHPGPEGEPAIAMQRVYCWGEERLHDSRYA